MKLEDYTLIVRRNADWGHWEAGLEEFFALWASGETELEARTELERLFLERRVYLEAAGKPMPVPGESPEPMFSTSTRIDAQAAMARDFFRRVLNLDFDEVYLCDAARLEEFGPLETLRPRVRAVYGVDLPDEPERPLWLVLAEIRASGG